MGRMGPTLVALNRAGIGFHPPRVMSARGEAEFAAHAEGLESGAPIGFLLLRDGAAQGVANLDQPGKKKGGRRGVPLSFFCPGLSGRSAGCRRAWRPDRSAGRS